MVVPSTSYLSASRLKKFYECQKCYVLKYEVKMPTEAKDDEVYHYGNMIHETIDGGQLKTESEVGEKYSTYLSHISKADKCIPKGGVSELEFAFKLNGFKCPYTGDDLRLYGFFDYVIGEGLREYDICALNVDNTDTDGTYWVDKKGDRIQISCAKIQRLVEIKTGTSNWSYNKLLNDLQFGMYDMVLNKLSNLGIATEKPIFSLANFNKTTEDVQNELVRYDEMDRITFYNKLQIRKDTIATRNFSQKSTCGFFSEYKDICPSFIIPS